jgi:carbon starvation protein
LHVVHLVEDVSAAWLENLDAFSHVSLTSSGVALGRTVCVSHPPPQKVSLSPNSCLRVAGFILAARAGSTTLRGPVVSRLLRWRSVDRWDRVGVDSISFRRDNWNNLNYGVIEMNSLTLLALALCAMGLAYRYYAAFLAAKVVLTDASRPTPAHEFRDGKDYHPTNKWVLFGHHFAAIAGAGPLIGPVLAAQYGYFPGAIWILVGAIFAGAVQDFIILHASVRNRGESISRIAHRYLGPVAGWCTAFAVLFIIIVALAGLAVAVVNALHKSPWGVFAIACSIPIAFLMGQWMYRIRPGRVTEASVIGVVLLIVGVLLGNPISHSSAASWFTLSEDALKLALPTYGFVAAVLPVWMLLCPRDYLSTYMKLGTVALLAVGIVIVHPDLRFPATTQFVKGGGPVIPGPVWPYVCITIMCGAISGFHALIGSGTTPKMLNSESDARPIGYGAMLVEGLVGLLALIAACSMYTNDYFAINANIAKFPQFANDVTQLPELTRMVGEETLVGRTGGAVTLAVGMARIFTQIPGMKGLMAYWYHFAIMFEALFILTTIDTGTRVARFILQEMLRPVSKTLSTGKSVAGVVVTSFVVTYAWYYLLKGGTVNTIWPMFGIANQLLGVIALAVGTTYILNKSSKRIYALTTFIPFLFLAVTIFTAGVQYTKAVTQGPEADYVKATLTVIMMALAAIVSVNCAAKWIHILSGRIEPEVEVGRDLMEVTHSVEVAD